MNATETDFQEDYKGYSGSDKNTGYPNYFGSTLGVSGTKDSDIIDFQNGDPGFGPALRDATSGRLTTYSLKPDSQVIDKAGVPDDTTDQRDYPRSVDGNGDGVAAADIGAFEYNPLWETEKLRVAAKSSDLHLVLVLAPGFSLNGGTRFSSNADGDFVTYEIPVPASRTYAVAVRGQRANDRGRFQLAVADSASGNTFTNVGSSQELYAPAVEFREFMLSNGIFLSEGTARFRFRVSGKNAASLSRRLVFDWIRLIAQ